MMSYFCFLQSQLSAISPDDDNFTEEPLQIAHLFCPFSVAMAEFLQAHAYTGAIDNTDAKVAYIRSTFEHAGMTPPREIRQWFTENQPILRDTAFQICFAFGLDGAETDEFFRRIFLRERSCDCHQVSEAIHYFSLNNGLSWAEAQEINAQIPPLNKQEAGTTIVYTDSIVRELNRLESKEELVIWLKENLNLFNTNNASAYRMIRAMWEQTTSRR